MTHPTPLNRIAGKILLATDLSARGDRALERAIALAGAWQAQLTLLHVFEDRDDAALQSRGHSEPSWRRPPDAVAIAKQRIRQGLRAEIVDAVDRASVRVEEGEPAQVIEEVAVEEGADLIVTGIASEKPFARESVLLGKTVERLLRRSPTPILVVRNRARASYQHILVATDFSDASGHALQAALRFFPLQPVHLLHAFEAPYASQVADAARYEDSYAKGLAGNLDAFLDSIFLPEEQRKKIRPLIERGAPPELIRDYVRDRQADLVVLGTQGRSVVVEALIGSTAKSILANLPCDALVIRGPRSVSRDKG